MRYFNVAIDFGLLKQLYILICIDNINTTGLCLIYISKMDAYCFTVYLLVL